MTLATLLIEAPMKSGAMITMDRALLHKKKLFALPGRVDNENFRGNHHLIKNGKAHLVENAADILTHFDSLFALPTHTNIPKPLNLTDLERCLLEKMPREETGIETLVYLTNLPVNQVHTALMGLILKKAIKEFPGKIFRKII